MASIIWYSHIQDYCQSVNAAVLHDLICSDGLFKATDSAELEIRRLMRTDRVQDERFAKFLQEIVTSPPAEFVRFLKWHATAEIACTGKTQDEIRHLHLKSNELSKTAGEFPQYGRHFIMDFAENRFVLKEAYEPFDQDNDYGDYGDDDDCEEYDVCSCRCGMVCQCAEVCG
jgi:hypothetical protein